MSTTGGANLASARRAARDLNAVYLLLVAYGDFGDCNRELAAAGTPGARGAKAAGVDPLGVPPARAGGGALRARDAAERRRGAPRRDADVGDGAPILVRALAALDALR